MKITVAFIISAVASSHAFANVNNGKLGEAETYDQLQGLRSLSIEKENSLTEEQIAEAKLKHRNTLLVLDNEYQALLQQNNSLRNQGSAKKLQAKSPETAEERMARMQIENSLRITAQKEAELESMLKSIETQIYVTDIFEIAGKVRGEFWHQGSVQTLSEGDSFGNWYISSLDFNGATVLPYNQATGHKDKAKTKRVSIMTSEEAISRFKKGQYFRDLLLEQKMEHLTTGAGSPFAPQAPQLLNTSPTPGLMFK